MRFTRKQRGGDMFEKEAESMKLPDEFIIKEIIKEIIKNQLFRQTMNFRVSEIEKKLQIIKTHLIGSVPVNNNARMKLDFLGGTRKRKRARAVSKKMT